MHSAGPGRPHRAPGGKANRAARTPMAKPNRMTRAPRVKRTVRTEAKRSRRSPKGKRTEPQTPMRKRTEREPSPPPKGSEPCEPTDLKGKRTVRTEPPVDTKPYEPKYKGRSRRATEQQEEMEPCPSPSRSLFSFLFTQWVSGIGRGSSKNQSRECT